MSKSLKKSLQKRVWHQDIISKSLKENISRKVYLQVDHNVYAQVRLNTRHQDQVKLHFRNKA